MASSIDAANPLKRKATEPSTYVGWVKTCKRCTRSNVKFKFLNNKKENQPRYQCEDCTVELGKPYHFNPFPIREHNHEHGYAKLPKVETEELKNLHKVCAHCHAENNATFRGYNNGKLTQPRYACKACKHLFSPLKNSKATNTNTNTDVSSQEYQTTGFQYEGMGASQQPNNTNLSSQGYQTRGFQYQGMEALQQQNNANLSSRGYQTPGNQYQGMGVLQQQNNANLLSQEFQTTGVQCLGMGASQQPIIANVPSQGYQTPGVQYPEPGVLHQPLSHDNLYEQTPILHQSYNSYDPYIQNSDNLVLPSMDAAGSSNEFLDPYQNGDAWHSQQPPSLYENTVYAQTSNSSQEHGYYYYPDDQSSDNHSLASGDVYGSSNQLPIPSHGAEITQQAPSYNSFVQQTSMPFEQRNNPNFQGQNNTNNPYSSCQPQNISSTPPQYPHSSKI